MISFQKQKQKTKRGEGGTNSHFKETGSIHQDIAKWEQQYEDSSIHELLIHQLPKNKLALKEKHNFQRQTWNTV